MLESFSQSYKARNKKGRLDMREIICVGGPCGGMMAPYDGVSDVIQFQIERVEPGGQNFSMSVVSYVIAKFPCSELHFWRFERLGLDQAFGEFIDSYMAQTRGCLDGDNAAILQTPGGNKHG